MKARLVKPVKHDLSSHSSVFTPVSPISKTEILSGKYPVKFYWILSDSGILPDTGIQIRYIPIANLDSELCFVGIEANSESVYTDEFEKQV